MSTETVTCLWPHRNDCKQNVEDQLGLWRDLSGKLMVTTTFKYRGI